MVDEDSLKIREYKNSKQIKKNFIQDKVVQAFLPVVKIIAKKICFKLPANIELDDLISFGVIGLMDALEKFNPDNNNKFRTYAEFRIRGSILDHLRAEDFISRSVRDKIKHLSSVTEKLTQQYNRPPTNNELIKSLGISEEDFFDLLNKTKKISFVYIDKATNFKKVDQSIFLQMSEEKKTNTPQKKLNDSFFQKKIVESIKNLSEKYKIVLSLYYFENLSLKEIGKILKITESRVSQIHSKGLLLLKNYLKEDFDIHEDLAA